MIGDMRKERMNAIQSSEIFHYGCQFKPVGASSTRQTRQLEKDTT